MDTKYKYHINLEVFIPALKDSIAKKRTTTKLAEAIITLVDARMWYYKGLGEDEDFRSDVLCTSLVKLDVIYNTPGKFSMDEMKDLQVFSYIRNMIRFASMEEFSRLNEGNDAIDITVVEDVEGFDVFEEGMAEALFHLKHEVRVNGYNVDMYELL